MNNLFQQHETMHTSNMYQHSGLESIWIRTEPTLVPARPYSYAGSVSTLMARPDYLQYPAYLSLFYLPH